MPPKRTNIEEALIELLEVTANLQIEDLQISVWFLLIAPFLFTQFRPEFLLGALDPMASFGKK